MNEDIKLNMGEVDILDEIAKHALIGAASGKNAECANIGKIAYDIALEAVIARRKLL